MDILQARKEKEEMRGFADRAKEFVQGAIDIYQNARKGLTDMDILQASIAMKLMSGEMLMNEMLMKGTETKDKQAKMVLEQLSLTVFHEMEHLGRLKIAIAEYHSAILQGKAADNAVFLRRLQRTAQDFMQRTGETE